MAKRIRWRICYPASSAVKIANAKRVADRTQAQVKGTTPTADATVLQGSYTDKVYGSASIQEVYGQPMLTLDPAKELFTGKLTHWHYDTWKWEHADPFLEPGYITFQFDTDHKVTGFKMDLHSPDFHFYKLDLRKN
jgi:hypothetical protein